MLKDILAISGQPGLFKMVSKGNNNVIVESLVNGKRFPAYSSNKIISLEDIAVFTTSGEVPLKEVLKKVSDNEELLNKVTVKSSANELKDFFVQILPDFDTDRVYVSDIKKIVQWYGFLKSNDLLNFEESTESAEVEKTEE